MGVHTVSFDFERDYTEDELLDLAIRLAKLEYAICSNIVAKRTGGKTSLEGTLLVTQEVMSAMADDMKTVVFGKAAKDARR